MANNLIEELLKKLGIGGAAQVDPTALPAGSQRPIEQVMSGDQQAKPAHRKTILNAFLPEQTEDETSARRRGLSAWVHRCLQTPVLRMNRRTLWELLVVA